MHPSVHLDVDLEVVREREGCEQLRRAVREPSGQLPRLLPNHPPAGPGGHGPMDRQAVLVEVDARGAVEIDLDALQLEAHPREPVRPGGEQRQGGRVPLTVGLEAAPQREELSAAVGERGPEHSQLWKERGAPVAVGELDAHCLPAR